MITKILFSLAFFLARLSPAFAAELPPFEQHFAPTENLETIDVGLIEAAGERIDIAAFVLTDVPVIEALTDAAARGVVVRVFRQVEDFAPNARIAAALKALDAAGAVERFKDPGSPLMHLKAYCLDGVVLRVGAANFSRSGLTNQNNDLEIARGPDVCAAFEREFEKMWSGK